ncbi:MAG: TonB-dependent siderophore receptor [Gomphosphaeria aponina SAG 52.96 = DSM 107014]|uniref:TonB-dependent siderophore receptor n=1 Tax=Gomphosphaeria aponina SAG 52.96 = DSM 107014 TaxID=1521640 RepID=A0A941JPC5_9CHRO|nr:TonB-dependent siderophore receptor [Gomphosphaeria aponina SAG 52.96 = DSM 107014]
MEVKLVRSEPIKSKEITEIKRVNDLDNYHTEARWLVQTSTVIVTGVQINPTETGLEIVLETPEKTGLQPLIFAEENTLIIDILGAVLQLPEGETFRVENPNSETTEVKVNQLDANSIRITITGKERVPIAEVKPSEDNLVLSVTPSSATRETPREEIEVVATGEQEENYFVRDASTATGTDTPIFDIPQSIQVVPQRIIRDRNVTELGDALETVPGVVSAGGRGTSAFGPGLIIRGFPVTESIFRDGIPFFSLSPLSTNDIESIEVLKGPASVLFGDGEPGGTINLVSKKPLADPFYSASFTAGNFNTYRGDIDISGPLNKAKTVKYRLNLSYENYGSFRDFVDGERWVVSPTLTWDIGPKTSINFYGQYTYNNETIDEGLPASGDRIVNVPRDRFLGEDFAEFEQDQFNLGYTFNHQFNENLEVRHALQYLQYEPVRYAPLFDFFDEETGELSRLEYAAGGTYKRFFTNAEVIGKFNTGSVKHQVLFGVEYRNYSEDPSFQFSNLYTSINVFDPIYTGIPFAIAPEFFRDDNIDRIGVYIQDQIDLLPNLKLLAGIRYDYASQFRTTRNLGEPREEFEQTDDDFSPRVGIVYQPIPVLAIYGSYTTSFNPAFAASRNPDDSTFDPETGEQFEVGIKANLSEQVSLTFAAFEIKKQNLSTQDPNNPAFSIQTGEQTSRGIEIYFGGELLPGWNLIAGYTYLDAYVSKDNTEIEGNSLENVPDYQFSLWTTYEIQQGNLEGLGFGLGLFYVDKRPGDLDNSFTIPSYLRTDAALYYRRDRWGLQLNIENLFDVEYFSSAGFRSATPGAPFTVSGKVTVEF